MSAPRPMVREFDVSIDADRAVRSGLGGTTLVREDTWSAEHLLLGALVRCTLTSLEHHLNRDGLTATASGSAHGTVTKRESDGLYAFVEIEARYDVDLDGSPARAAVLDLLDRAERGCFVGNSLSARPRYRWTVNGEKIR